MHGIGQPLGAAVPDPVEHLPLLRKTADQLDAVWVSEHLSFNRVAIGATVAESGFLLPPCQNEASVRIAARNVASYRTALERPVAFETGVNYLQPQDDELSDGQFWRRIADGADSGILLDLHNLWCNELNGRQRVLDVIDQLPLDRVWEIHLAGGMALAGYWLDSHSDRIPAPLLDLAAQIIPRLPNLSALMYELLPEHFDSLGTDGVAEQVAALSQLWQLRSPVTYSCLNAGRQPGEPSSADLLTSQVWEVALFRAILGEQSPGDRHRWLIDDPGVGVYRELVSDFRRGALARTLRYTMTLLLLSLGRQRTGELLDSFFIRCPAQSYRAVEADNFARFLGDRSDLLRQIRYLGEVLRFEHALVRAVVFDEATHLEWTIDPTAVLQALDRGQLPESLPAAPSSMRISV